MQAWPRLYYLPLFAQLPPLAEWERRLDEIAGLGFDHVVTPSPAQASAAGMAVLGEAARRRKLKWIVDIDPSRIALHHPLLLRFDSLFAPLNDDAAIDPRLDPRLGGTRTWLGVASDADIAGYAAGWADMLFAWRDAGISGVRCTAPGHMPAAFWLALIDASRAASAPLVWMAWTPGLSPTQLAALAPCGFDWCFSSLRWWDFRAPWFLEERERLRAIAPAIAFPEDPLGMRLRLDLPVHERDHAALVERRYRRLLAACCLLGDGLMLPAGFEYGCARPLQQKEAEAALFDLRPLLQTLNELPRRPRWRVRALSAGQAPVTALLCEQGPAGEEAELVLINPAVDAGATARMQGLAERTGSYTLFGEPALVGSGELTQQEGNLFKLPPAGVATVAVQRAAPVLQKNNTARSLKAALTCPRLTIENITPQVDNGLFAARRVVGETVAVEADVFTDGHDKIAVAMRWRTADLADWHEVRMQALGNDRYRAHFPLQRVGRHQFTVVAWRDTWATLRDELFKKHQAGQNVWLVTCEIRQTISDWATRMADVALRARLGAFLKQLGKDDPAPQPTSTRYQTRVELLLSDDTDALLEEIDPREFLTEAEPLPLDAERTVARFASWYELFPRSMSPEPGRHGTFDDVIPRLPAIRQMGFDVLYFPPIHPIGMKHRKGKNNSLTAKAGEPGSPYAIGSEDGGHDALHPELGDFAAFRRLLEAARAHELEIALDFAIQCSPDHPWLREHPEWFQWRPDGSVRHAENPPKKYEDIVNVDFYTQAQEGAAAPALWMALRDVVLFWVSQGVRIFRVDNPHTKPLPFWQWMIAEVRGRFPSVIFLAEAFTRPRMMARLGKIGFTQSYTYFTWRNTKEELTTYLEELNAQPLREFYRPHFFVNTPDINPVYLQRSGRAGFVIRAALAGLLSGLWGLYSGFELCESAALPGKEEYLDAEKYEFKQRDWNQPGNIVAEVTLINHIRHANPALHTHLGIHFCPSSNGQVLCFVKATPSHDNVIVAAVNLDPFNPQETEFDLPLWRFGLADHGTVAAHDLVSNTPVQFSGRIQRVYLNPATLPFAVWRLDVAEVEG